MKWLALLIFVIACQAIGFIGSVPTIRAIPSWYKTLRRPAWTPPNRIFAPVWTLLYLLMAIAAWRCWVDTGFTAWAIPFALQLALNLAWSWIFFGWKQIASAAVEMVFLWASILWSVLVMGAIDPTSGLLLIPYLLWVSFALALNLSFWTLNRPTRSTNAGSDVR